MNSDFERAIKYLDSNFDTVSGFASYTALNGDFSQRKKSPPEIFSSLIILQCLMDIGVYPTFLRTVLKHLESVTNPSGFVHFFFDKKMLVADTDCTAVGHALRLALDKPTANLNPAVDNLVKNTNDDGIIQVYQKPAGEHADRIDTNVLVNVLYLLHMVNRAKEAAISGHCILRALNECTYIEGSRYYPSPDVFLYFLSRLVRDFRKAKAEYGALLSKELNKRKHHEGTSLELALRCAAFDNIGDDPAELRENIHEQQNEDGSWPANTFFKYGRTNRCFGGEALSTAFGARALSRLAHHSEPILDILDGRDIPLVIP